MTEQKKERRAMRHAAQNRLAYFLRTTMKYSPNKARFFARVIYDRQLAAEKTA